MAQMLKGIFTKMAKCEGGIVDGVYFHLPLGIVTPHICIDPETKDITQPSECVNPYFYTFWELREDEIDRVIAVYIGPQDGK
jgi:hypothetical protein